MEATLLGLEQALGLATEAVTNADAAIERAVADKAVAVAKRDHLAVAVEHLRLALDPEKTVVAALRPAAVAAEARDRRAVQMTDETKLRGLRRVAFDIMIAAGDAGITNENFRTAALAAMTPAQIERATKSLGGLNRAVMDGHIALRKNAENFGYTMVEITRGTWALRRLR